MWPQKRCRSFGYNMESLDIALAMMAAVGISGALARMLPAGIPLPLIQIALGFVIAGVFEEGVELDPDVFFLLFLPPLLFLDGWRIPKEGLWREKGGIIQLSFGLVLLTVLGLGLILHWLIPAMPLAVAFAVAAIVSPTDPVAVSAITRKVPVPKRLMSVLEGESLFNDATGLVAFRTAVAAVVTGTFSISHAALSFIWVAAAGLATGVVVTWGLSRARTAVVKRVGEEPGAEVLLSLMVPFAAYFAAEYISASGILAAVSAGVTMSYVELSGSSSALTRMHRQSTWNVVQFALNGTMFVLLGEQLPGIYTGAVEAIAETGHHNPLWLVVYALVICIVLGVFRFGWVYASVRFEGWRKRRRGIPFPEVGAGMMMVLTLGGVRGAITLAGVLTLPLVLNDGTPFPARDLAILLAATVIITSLVLASALMPPVVKMLRHQSSGIKREQQEYLAVQTAREAAERALQEEVDRLTSEFPDAREQDLLSSVAERLLADIRAVSAVSELGLPDEWLAHEKRVEQRMRLAVIDAARQSIFALARQHKISDELAREMVARLDMEEVRNRH
jgi:Na+/H+ antiporter|tara:strand:- start:84540 stop:86225 length:1686 start_codon:yes stop_codon:yes gene_type:complete